VKDGWKHTRHGAKLISIKLQSTFDPTVALHINPHPECPLCVLNDAPKVLTALHSSRYAGESYRLLLEEYGELFKIEGIELNMNVLVKHFSEHFVMRNR